jgi:hypothetical protein
VSDSVVFWRSTLAKALFAWMASSVLVVLSWGRLDEISTDLARWTSLIVVLGPIPPLLGWSLWAVFRRPRRNWPGPVLLVALCIAFGAALVPLVWSGSYLNFLSHRSAYARIVADARSGKLPRLGAEAFARGQRYGVAYAVEFDADVERMTIYFDWGDPYGFTGIVYSEGGCPWVDPPPEPPPNSAPPGEPQPPTIKHAGRPGSPWWHFGGHYCFTVIDM